MTWEVFKPPRRFWTPEEDATIERMIEAHASTVAIARELHRTPRSVTMRIRRLYEGPTGRPRGAAAGSSRWRPA